MALWALLVIYFTETNTLFLSKRPGLLRSLETEKISLSQSESKDAYSSTNKQELYTKSSPSLSFLFATVLPDEGGAGSWHTDKCPLVTVEERDPSWESTIILSVLKRQRAAQWTEVKGTAQGPSPAKRIIWHARHLSIVKGSRWLRTVGSESATERSGRDTVGTVRCHCSVLLLRLTCLGLA